VVVAPLSWGTRLSAQEPSPSPSALPDALPNKASDELSPAKLLERLRKIEVKVNEFHQENENLQGKDDEISQELSDTKKTAVSTAVTEDFKPKSDYDIGPIDDLDPSDLACAGRSNQRSYLDESYQAEGGFTRGSYEQGVGNQRLGELPLIGICRRAFKISFSRPLAPLSEMPRP
jgi:hypothetical protein